MITVKNLTASPYDLQSVDGNVRLPAFGEVTGEFADEYLALLESSMAVKVVPADDKFIPDCEHPNADAKGLAKIDRLRAEYTELVGKKPFYGWNAEQLQKRIDAALAA